MVKLPSIQITVSCGSHKTTSHDAISYFTAEKLKPYDILFYASTINPNCQAYPILSNTIKVCLLT